MTRMPNWLGAYSPLPDVLSREGVCVAAPESDRRKFFGDEPGDENAAAQREREQEIIEMYCANCPVTSACLAHALETPEIYGVWGATGESARAELALGIAQRPHHPVSLVEAANLTGFDPETLRRRLNATGARRIGRRGAEKGGTENVYEWESVSTAAYSALLLA